MALRVAKRAVEWAEKNFKKPFENIIKTFNKCLKEK